MKYTIRIICGLWFALTLWACDVQPVFLYPEHLPCTSDADCTGGVCVNGQCMIAPGDVDLVDSDDTPAPDGDSILPDGDSPEIPEALQPECEEGSYVCLDNISFHCDRGHWSAADPCQLHGKLCLEGHCVSRPDGPEQPEICEDNSTRCNGDTIEVCLGGIWYEYSDCSMGDMLCVQGECRYPDPQDTCRGYDTLCIGNSLWRCGATHWEFLYNCGPDYAICEDGACVEYIPWCFDDGYMCFDNILFRCRQGHPVAASDCSASMQSCTGFGCGRPGHYPSGSDCTDGETICEYDTMKTCINGMWVASIECSLLGEQCVNDRCTPCTDGQRACIGETLWECAGGEWKYRRFCPSDGNICLQGACTPPVSTVGLPLPCEESATTCLNNDQYICMGGAWFYNANCLATGRTCQRGMCLLEEGRDALCPSYYHCLPWTTGDYVCQEPGGGAPNEVPCTNHNDCLDNGGLCIPKSPESSQRICLRPCGVCPTGQYCQEVPNNSGLRGCYYSNSIPIEAQTGCAQDSDCPDFHFCRCANEECAITACIRGCSR